MAEIRFLPVCSNCGTILKYREIEFGEDEFGSIDAYLFKANNGRISPNQCPICGIVFDRAEQIRVSVERCKVKESTIGISVEWDEVSVVTESEEGS